MEQIAKMVKQYQTELSDDYMLLRIQARLIRTEAENQIKRYRRKIQLLQYRCRFSNYSRNYPFQIKHYQRKIHTLQHSSSSRLIGKVTNVTPVNYDADKIMRTFTWSAVLVLAASVCSILSFYFVGLIIGFILSRIAAGICAYIILPILAYHYINKSTTGKYAWNEMMLRHALLAFAIIEGTITGYVLSDRVIASPSPIAEITPLIIGFVTPILKPIVNDNRTVLLGATIGGSFGLHMLIGMMLGLSSGYILLAIMYTLIGLVTLQLFIASVNENTVFTHDYQFSIIYFTLLSEFFVYELLGGKPEDIRR